MDAMDFEWDPDKAARNLRKHGVSFQEAATVFGDLLAMTYSAPEHSDEEDRYITLGKQMPAISLSCGTRIETSERASSALER